MRQCNRLQRLRPPLVHPCSGEDKSLSNDKAPPSGKSPRAPPPYWGAVGTCLNRVRVHPREARSAAIQQFRGFRAPAELPKSECGNEFAALIDLRHPARGHQTLAASACFMPKILISGASFATGDFTARAKHRQPSKKDLERFAEFDYWLHQSLREAHRNRMLEKVGRNSTRSNRPGPQLQPRPFPQKPPYIPMFPGPSVESSSADRLLRCLQSSTAGTFTAASRHARLVCGAGCRSGLRL